MIEPTNRQTVTITQGQVTVIATIALLFAALVSSITLAVSIITYDRALQHSQRIDNIEIRVLTLEAYQSARSKADGSSSVQGDSLRRPAESGD
jgi:hypothetical protein